MEQNLIQQWVPESPGSSVRSSTDISLCELLREWQSNAVAGKKTVSTTECKSEIVGYMAGNQQEPRHLSWWELHTSSCMVSSGNFSQEELQETPNNLVNQGICLQPEKLHLNTLCIWTKGSGILMLLKSAAKTLSSLKHILLSVPSSTSNLNVHDKVLHSKASIWTCEILPLLWKSYKLLNTQGLVWKCEMEKNGAIGAIHICQWHQPQLCSLPFREYWSITAYVWPMQKRSIATSEKVHLKYRVLVPCLLLLD